MEIATNVKNYISPKDGSTCKINRTPTQLSWRLAHDGVKVIALFESTGETGCIHKLFCATTLKECENEIARLGLKMPPELATIKEVTP